MQDERRMTSRPTDQHEIVYLIEVACALCGAKPGEKCRKVQRHAMPLGFHVTRAFDAAIAQARRGGG